LREKIGERKIEEEVKKEQGKYGAERRRKVK
jgi:hypothetical protein